MSQLQLLSQDTVSRCIHVIVVCVSVVFVSRRIRVIGVCAPVLFFGDCLPCLTSFETTFAGRNVIQHFPAADVIQHLPVANVSRTKCDTTVAPRNLTQHLPAACKYT